jgi:uncharacterized protein
MSGDLASDQAVTAVVTRRVRSGCEPAYEEWLARLQADSRNWPGYLGVTTRRPAPGAPRDYVSVIRFASLEDLQAYERSDLRARAMAAVQPYVEADAVWEHHTGLEFWFTPAPGAIVAIPSRPRMVVLMVTVVFSLVMSIGGLVNLATQLLPFELPFPVRLLITITLEVLLMTYWLMPWLTRRLAPWIYPKRGTP